MAERSSLERLQDTFAIELDWRGFELHPEIPLGGMRADRLFGPGGRERANAYVRGFAASFGIHDMQHPEHIPNTRAALAAAEWARDQGRLHPFRAAAMDAYWRHRRDIGDPNVIRDLAFGVGLDPDGAVAAMTDRAFLDRIADTRDEAGANGVTGIPTFFIGDAVIVGCQPYDTLAGAVERAEADGG